MMPAFTRMTVHDRQVADDEEDDDENDDDVISEEQLTLTDNTEALRYHVS